MHIIRKRIEYVLRIFVNISARKNIKICFFFNRSSTLKACELPLYTRL